MSGARNGLRRVVIVAVVVALVVLVGIVVLDHFGAQPQPFQYLLH
ncbi:MAG: hypothetical protein R3B81_19265 [bacterium]